jgi:hypothetical protein
MLLFYLDLRASLTIWGAFQAILTMIMQATMMHSNNFITLSSYYDVVY